MNLAEKQSPYAALKYPQFVAFIFANSFMTIAILIQEVVLGYAIYKMTHDPLALGLIGLAEALPYISLALFGGHLADRRNKKTLMQVSLSFIIVGSIILIWATSPSAQLSQSQLLTVVYGVIMLIGFARGFYSPASGSLNPFLIPKEVFANAATWQSSFWQAGAILGPGFAGFLYAYLGLTNTLWIVVGLFILVMILLSTITAPPIPTQNERKVNIFESLREGIAYVFKTKVILYSISLDLFSVLFGGVIALLPIYSEDILHVGAEGLGILRAAPSIGAVLTMLVMVYYPPTNNAWRNLLLAITGFGIATLVFAVSTNVWLSAGALFLTGELNSQTYNVSIKPFSERSSLGKGEKYHVSIRYSPNSMLATFLILVTSSCSRRDASSSPSCSSSSCAGMVATMCSPNVVSFAAV